jgi:predicted PurR-regulated permease PerM
VDFLKSLAGMFTSSLLRLAVSVGILAAAYFFIVRPVLDTTNDAINSANTYSNGINSNIGRQIQRSIRQTNRQVQRQVNRSLRQTSPNRAGQKRLLRCVQRAHGNANRIQRCARRF